MPAIMTNIFTQMDGAFAEARAEQLTQEEVGQPDPWSYSVVRVAEAKASGAKAQFLLASAKTAKEAGETLYTIMVRDAEGDFMGYL